MRTSSVPVSVAVLALGLGCLGAGPAVAGPAAEELPPAPTLSGFSVLPAATFGPGSEPSGAFVDGQPAAPYPGQPVQGFSGVHAAGDGTYLAMSDNGFGAKANSQDFLLSVHRIAPNLEGGEIRVLETITLSDPDGHIPWAIWRDGGCEAATDLPAGYECPAPDRILTGWDFDLESMQVAKDGTLWFGEEFGPYLLHTDAQGRLLEAPIKLPGVTSPSDPDPEAPAANLANSKGFEGMAIAPNSRTLYPMLEGATAEDKAAGLAADRRIYEVQIGAGNTATAFTGEYLRYRMEEPSHNVGDFIAINAHQFLVIERDDSEGAAADFKRGYLVDIRDRDRDGYVDKRELVDLMHVADPQGLASADGTYRMPYFTIEDVEILDQNTIAVLNDNNYRSTGGRGADVVDVTEFVTIDLPENLKVDHRLLPGAVEGRQHGGPQAPEHGRPPAGFGATDVSYVDSMVLPDELRTVDGTAFGGLSGLDYRAEEGTYLALSDDRSQKGPARFSELTLPFDDEGFLEDGYSVVETTVLQRQDGTTYPEADVDPESIRWDENTGTALWTDEGDANQGIDPAVREITEDGEFVRAFEIPTQYRLQYDETGTQTAGVRNNLALENLTISPDGTTFSVMTEGALVQDGPIARPEHGTRLRLAQFDRETGEQQAQYVYETEPMSAPIGSTGGDRGATEILQIGENEYLVVERQYFNGANEIQVFKASTEGATEVSGLDALTGIEVPMTKELLIDLEVAEVGPDNVEAITFGPRFDDGDASLVLVSDDNFNVEHQDTVFHLLRVDTEK